MKELSKMLDVKIININDAFNNKDIRSSINAKKYKFYKYEYLTSKKIKNINNVDILKKIIFNNEK